MFRDRVERDASEADASQEVTSEVPEAGTGLTHEFPCKNCGAGMTWDPDADALTCEYCGEHLQVPRGEGTILERPLEAAGTAGRGLGLERRVARCEECGASITYDQSATSEACVYCGSAAVLSLEARRNALRPESLVPLDVARTDVERSFRKWISGLWFRPSALKRTRRFDARGIYVPFWTYDCRVHSDWSADAGYYYWVTQSYVVRVGGRTEHRRRRVRKVRWTPAWGDRDDAYDDVLVNASRGLPDELVAKLGGFDTRALVPYRPEYLAGWRSEEYQVDLEQGWEAARVRVEEGQRARCAADVPGDTQRNLRVQNRVSDVRWKHVLLPLWSVQYRFRGKVYTVLVNGQTGGIVGRAPLSWPKILALAAGVLLAVAAGVVLLGGR